MIVSGEMRSHVDRLRDSLTEAHRELGASRERERWYRKALQRVVQTQNLMVAQTYAQIALDVRQNDENDNPPYPKPDESVKDFVRRWGEK